MRNYLKEAKVHYIKIRIKTKNAFKVIKLLSSLNINLHEITITNNYLYLKIVKKDLNTIKKIIKVKKINDYGVYKSFKNIKNNLINIYVIIISLIFIFIISHFTADVNVIHSNTKLRETILDELWEQGIKKFSIKKDYQELQIIKNNILEKYKDQIEWLEIIPSGMNYIVKVQDKLLTSIDESTSTCHVVATKEGIIRRIISTSGEIIKNPNNLVREGEIIVSGEIKLNEETKENVCAEAKVYAETWYTVSVTMPKEQIIKEYTGQEKINFMLETPYKKYKILRSRLEIFDDQNKLLIKVGDYKFYFQKEKEYIENVQLLSNQQVLDNINYEIKSKLATKLKDDYQILSQKVLKKSINDSTIYVEVFVTVEEQIGLQQEYVIEEKGDE